MIKIIKQILTKNSKEIGNILPWKDASEQPTEQLLSVIVKLTNGEICFANWKGKGCLRGFCEIGSSANFNPKVEQYCTLTNFTNSIESMLSRQNEFEKRIKKLEENND